MFGKKKSDEDAIDAAVVHVLLSGMKPEHRQGVLSQLNDNERRQVLNAELEGRADQWERKNGTEWGQS
ncbi:MULTISPECIES: hypothetical protein [unclassified Amycolatopsis]|uniref:hypothetical protein n=1 Tax=unclassified Amycolatopsis TaxID=2618356 RepID=UPI0028761125|nr:MULTISPECIES: hypothetical protein [unclassified Amycolatopsis]MDS0139937.1 hypothetical protein [Amycolatopsis sp. 505]MDS0148151.1 hypothetical protein [Amycolatopsis sp. CM201R]